MDSPEPAYGSAIRRVNIGGLPTVALDAEDMATMMVEDCKAARISRAAAAACAPKLVFSSNGQGISLANRDRKFHDTMTKADMIHADGMSVVFASRLLGTPLPERVATTDFFHNAARAAQREGLSFFMLGSSEAQNAKACEKIKEAYPDLKIVGRRNGYFPPEEEANVCAEIVASGADVLWIALGKPAQEEFCVRNKERLQGVGWLKTCGGLYAFLAGDAKRAPRWMQNAGLEWAFRAMQDPRRLLWRYLTTNPHAFLSMLFGSRGKI